MERDSNIMEMDFSTSTTTAASMLAQLRATTTSTPGNTNTAGRERRATVALYRDPRAPPLSIQKNVSIAATCQFYGTQDAISSCRVSRSCQDCLEMPGCVIRSSGKCHATGDTSWSPSEDYHIALTQYPHGDGYNRMLSTGDSRHDFFAENATYCSASDSICLECRSKFQALASSRRTVNVLRTQFCVGAAGCVCIAACEVPSLVSLRDIENNCPSNFPTHLFKWKTSAEGALALPPFTTRRRDPRAPLSAPVHSRKGQESCRFYADLDIQGCRKPRSCSDCLQKQGCMISGNQCLSMDEYYDITKDFRNMTFPASLVQFPSEATRVCPVLDAVCTKCRAARATSSNSYWQYRWEAPFCVGDGGCVCIELCENPGSSTMPTKDPQCYVGSVLDVSGPANVVIGVFAMLFGSIAVLTIWKKTQQRGQERQGHQQPLAVRGLRRHMLDEAPTLHLDLYGWRRFRHELLDKERQLLAGAQEISPVAGPTTFDFEALPTAPDFDEDEDSTAPTATNPHALASAPVFRLASLQRPGLVVEEDDSELHLASAPDFDD